MDEIVLGLARRRLEAILVERPPERPSEVTSEAVRGRERDHGDGSTYDYRLRQFHLRRRQVQVAIQRLAMGDYGKCLHCDEDISPKRIEFKPEAFLCVGCQEKLDRDEIELEPQYAHLTVRASRSGVPLRH